LSSKSIVKSSRSLKFLILIFVTLILSFLKDQLN
jgi:hypothetical protein